MNEDARRKLENQLIVMGLNRLTDPDLIPQMARLIPDGATLAGMLNECNQERRREMYYALRPYLPFKPLSFDHYMDFFKRKAEAIESEYQPYEIGAARHVWAPVIDDEPVMIGGKKFREASPDDAEGVLLKLTCHKCTRSEEFYGQTPVEAVSVARSVGWVRNLVLQKEICPKCPAARRVANKKASA